MERMANDMHSKPWLTATAILALITGATLFAQAPQTEVVLDGQSPGQVFDGIGAVSAGASSRLLVDYPEPYRSQILDYLFKPDYGASLQHLKVEIGADVNSTDGSEPSQMRTRSDHDYSQGYEWWLMNEARKRNPDIVLDTLAWGAPGWIGGGDFYSDDMANYVADFIEGAKRKWGLDIAYTGIWNEKHFESPEYVKILRRVLDEHHLNTKIVCCDEYPREGVDQWTILDAMRKDPALRDAVSVVTVHYPRMHGKVTTPDSALGIGKPLWSSEDQPASSASFILSRNWPSGGRALAQLYNDNYLKGHFTATEIWSPITSYYDNLAAPNSGLMYANTPWSGHYDVQSAIWVTAHTTQFAQPGWKYMEKSCGNLPEKGDYVALKSPDGKNWSVVLQTIDATHPQTVQFTITGGLSTATVHIWETNKQRTFEHVADVPVHDAKFKYTFDPDSLYSLTTTTGQHKGTAESPAAAPFPFPYTENFESTPLLRSPKFLADQDGAFEVQKCEGRAGQCLEQVITERPIPWGPLPDPWTMAGNADWADYKVGADVRIDGTGCAMVIGRIDSANVFSDQQARLPSGYALRLHSDGIWELLSTTYHKPTLTLAQGKTSAAAGEWHHLELVFHGDTIKAELDGKTLSSVQDNGHRKGMIGIGSEWNRAQFDNLAVTGD
ncbi:MAG TPA: family 16 glycoside hydrolase [Terracidiphilus sp.]|nr:family 16 glycoside hydrolase [Terracidiphilus sp.]